MWQESMSARAHAAMACFPLIEDFDDDPPTLEAAADEPAEDEPFAPPPPDADEIAASRDAAYAAGRRDERAEIATERSIALDRTLASMAGQLRDAGREASAVAEAAAEETARLLLRVLAAMMPALCARHGAADAVALVRAVVPALLHEPRVTIRVNPHVRDAVAAELARVAPDWADRIALVATDAMAPGDARVAWDNGTASRDVAELWDQVIARLAPLGLLDEATARSFARETAHV